MRAWSDRLVPTSLRSDPQTLSRARLTVVLSLVLFGAAIAYAVFYGAVVGFTAGAVSLACGAGVGALVLVVLRLRAWLRACGHLLTGVLYTVLAALVYHSGGIGSPVTPWLITPPIFAILLLGRHGAAAWSALCVLTIAALHLAGAAGVSFPVGYPAEWAARLTLWSYAGLVVCTAILLFVFEDIRAGAQAQAEAANAALARLAYHDPLTGLANRARFFECLDAALAEAREAGDPARVAVLLLDLDGFKGVNDTMGHAAGDALLSQVAARLLNATRGCDTVARLGGDEFAVLLGNVRHDDDASVVARRVVAAIAVPFALKAGQARVGASLGVARAAPAPGAEPGAAAALLHQADLAMYRAKALGRDRWVWFEPGMAAEPRAAGGPAGVLAELAPPRLGLA